MIFSRHLWEIYDESIQQFIRCYLKLETQRQSLGIACFELEIWNLLMQAMLNQLQGPAWLDRKDPMGTPSPHSSGTEISHTCLDGSYSRDDMFPIKQRK